MASAALLVTFRPYLAQVFRHRCKAADITPITCGSLDAGWRALMTVRPDLLILDGGFAYKELQDFSRWYRANPEMKAVPVAVLVPPNLRGLAGMLPLQVRWQLHIPLSADELEQVLIEGLQPAISTRWDLYLVRLLADSDADERAFRMALAGIRSTRLWPCPETALPLPQAVEGSQHGEVARVSFPASR